MYAYTYDIDINDMYQHMFKAMLKHERHNNDTYYE